MDFGIFAAVVESVEVFFCPFFLSFPFFFFYLGRSVSVEIRRDDF